MRWRIRRRKTLLGGLVSVNLSKRGLGFSFGVKGARVGVNAKGQTYSQALNPGYGDLQPKLSRQYGGARATSYSCWRSSWVINRTNHFVDNNHLPHWVCSPDANR
jgi:hypothetical protein